MLSPRHFRPATEAGTAPLQQWFKWLHAEGDIAPDPMARMKAPTVPDEPPAAALDRYIRRRAQHLQATAVPDRRRFPPRW